MIIEYEYDQLSRPVRVKDNGEILAEYEYYRDHYLKEVRFGNGIVTRYGYDADANLASLVTEGKNGEVLLSYSYAYDGNGNRIRKKGAEGSLMPGETRYGYDKVQRIARVTYPEGKEESFGYDSAGNRAWRRYGNLEESYAYDRRNRLLERVQSEKTIQSADSFAGLGHPVKLCTAYTYDSQGNTLTELLTRVGGQAQTEPETELLQKKSYCYTLFHQTSRAEAENCRKQTKEVQESFYDAEGLRYAISENGRKTNFITDGWEVFEELDEDGGERKRLVRGYGITASEERGKEYREAGYHYYHANEHGDIELLTGEKGGICNQYQYDAFGRITKAEELIANRYTYYGEVYDSITEQYYLRARNYNPQTARFTQEDVYRGDGLNLYAYCANNAVMYVDPSGYNKKKCPTDKEKNRSNEADITNEGGTVPKSNRLALRLSDYLDDFASTNNAHTWKDLVDPTNWKTGVNDALFDPNMEIVVNLDGVDNPLLAAQRAASNMGGATDWELLQIKLTPSAWDRITWYKSGKIIPNPFE